VSAPKLVVDTDLLIEHLVGERHPSPLRRAARHHLCYTTVVQAGALFAVARTATETQAVEDCLGVVKILGINAKLAAAQGRLRARHPRLDPSDAWTAALCLESRLPLLTGRPGRFRGIRGLAVMTRRSMGASVRRTATAHH